MGKISVRNKKKIKLKKTKHFKGVKSPCGIKPLFTLKCKTLDGVAPLVAIGLYYQIVEPY